MSEQPIERAGGAHALTFEYNKYWDFFFVCIVFLKMIANACLLKANRCLFCDFLFDIYDWKRKKERESARLNGGHYTRNGRWNQHELLTMLKDTRVIIINNKQREKYIAYYHTHSHTTRICVAIFNSIQTHIKMLMKYQTFLLRPFCHDSLQIQIIHITFELVFDFILFLMLINFNYNPI